MKLKLKDDVLYFLKLKNGDEFFTKIIKNGKRYYLNKPLIIKDVMVQPMQFVGVMGPYINIKVSDVHIFEFDITQVMIATKEVAAERISTYYNFWMKFESGKIVFPDQKDMNDIKDDDPDMIGQPEDVKKKPIH